MHVTGGMDKLTGMLDYLLQEVSLAAPPAPWDHAPGTSSWVPSTDGESCPSESWQGRVWLLSQCHHGVEEVVQWQASTRGSRLGKRSGGAGLSTLLTRAWVSCGALLSCKRYFRRGFWAGRRSRAQFALGTHDPTLSCPAWGCDELEVP